MKSTQFIIYIFLFFLASCNSGKRAGQMNRVLTEADSLNRQNIRIDTLYNKVKELTEYYRHDESKLAFADYLMGCVYRDKGDAPMALKYYNDAVALIDTTDENADYGRLSRIYGQIAYIYHEQSSPLLQLNAIKKAMKYAMLAKDTLAYIAFYEGMAGAYHIQGKFDSALYVNNAAARMYEEYGRKDLAAAVMPLTIDISLRRHEYSKAKMAIDKFEKYAAAANLNISYLKGDYYCGINKLDSAAFFYRQLLHKRSQIDDLEAGYRGLMKVYQQTGAADSVSKYAMLYAAVNDSSNVLRSAKEVVRMQALYNYSAKEELAANKEKETADMRFLVVSLLLLFILIALVATFYITDVTRKRKREKQLQSERYNQAQQKYATLNEELNLLKSDINKYREKKEQEIIELRQQLDEKKEETSNPDTWKAERDLMSGDLVITLHDIALKGQMASGVELDDLRKLVSKKLPYFYNIATDKKYLLTEQEINVCLFIRLGFQPSDIAVLLNVSVQRLTNIRSSINEKMFHSKGAKTLDSHIKRIKVYKV